MKSKLLIAVASIVMLTGFTAATTNYDGPSDQPHIMEQPNNNTPDDAGPGNNTLPNLLGQASDHAQQVLNGISEAFNRGLDNLGQNISHLISMN